ncbi:MAG: hypothetical protein ACI8PZ_006479 [Myxococcota bacterium]|jgi:hypothetical protein
MALRVFAILAGVLVAQPALAQDGGIRSELERSASTSDDDKLDYAETARTEIADTLRSVTKALEGARREGDADKIQCLTSRLTSVRALQVVTDGAATSMRSAIENGEAEKADHEFRKIAVALGKTRMLSAEAQQCDSGAGVQPGETVIELLSELLSDEEIVDLLEQLELDQLQFGMDPPDVSPFQ